MKKNRNKYKEEPLEEISKTTDPTSPDKDADKTGTDTNADKTMPEHEQENNDAGKFDKPGREPNPDSTGKDTDADKTKKENFKR